MQGIFFFVRAPQLSGSVPAARNRSYICSLFTEMVGRMEGGCLWTEKLDQVIYSSPWLPPAFSPPPHSCLTKERSDRTNDRAISSGSNDNADGNTMELG